MANKTDKTDYRYVNDLRRLAYSQEKSIEQKKSNRPALSLTSLTRPSAVPAAGDRRRSQGQRPLFVRQTVIPLRIPQGIH